VKEAIFHPEARVEMNESFDFYEARLDGLGIRFLLAVEQTVERISTHPTPVLLSALANSANGSFLVFPTTSSTASGKFTFTSLQLLMTAVVQVIGANEPIVANYRVEKDAADRASHPKRSAENLPRKASIETTRCRTRRPLRTTFTARS
jgi:hypothetical protein